MGRRRTVRAVEHRRNPIEKHTADLCCPLLDGGAYKLYVRASWPKFFTSRVGCSEQCTFRNARLSIEERTNDLVSRLTLEEKTAQMVHTAPAIPRLGIPPHNLSSEGFHG